MMPFVFISYSSRDQETAVKLAKDLRAEGHDVWLDKWRIHVGHSISAEIERGIESPSFLIALQSSKAVASSWVDREWRAAYWNEVEAKSVRVLPAVLEACAVPQLL